MKLELVARTQGVGKYEGLTSEEIVAAIARHGTIKKDDGRLIKYLMKEHHWSPLDMINFTFEVETSRAIGRQWLRHASIKPQEHSQRYSDRVLFEHIELRKEHPTNRQSSTEIFDPVITIRSNDKRFLSQETGPASAIIEKHLAGVEILYQSLLEAGVAKECARMILPECATSTLTFNGSLRSWLAFLNVRCDHHAQKEIVVLANLVGEALEKEMPNVFSNIDWRKGMFM